MQLSISVFWPCISVMQSVCKMCAVAALSRFSFPNTEATDRLTRVGDDVGLQLAVAGGEAVVRVVLPRRRILEV